MVVLVPKFVYTVNFFDMFLSADKTFQELQLSYIQDAVCFTVCGTNFP